MNRGLSPVDYLGEGRQTKPERLEIQEIWNQAAINNNPNHIAQQPKQLFVGSVV